MFTYSFAVEFNNGFRKMYSVVASTVEAAEDLLCKTVLVPVQLDAMVDCECVFSLPVS